jgi:hypothetical protein
VQHIGLQRISQRTCQRPRRRAAEQRDELPPSHSITSSARASRNGGRCAAEQLMNSINLAQPYNALSAGTAEQIVERSIRAG